MQKSSIADDFPFDGRALDLHFGFNANIAPVLLREVNKKKNEAYVS